MMATTKTLRSVLRTSRGQHILKLQSAEQRASLALDLLSLGSRAALGVSFLMSVSDRLGFYGNPGERGVSWGTFERFLGYAAKVNAFAPAWMMPFLGTAATVLEFLFGVTLVFGLALRWAAFGSAGLLFLRRIPTGDAHLSIREDVQITAGLLHPGRRGEVDVRFVEVLGAHDLLTFLQVVKPRLMSRTTIASCCSVMLFSIASCFCRAHGRWPGHMMNFSATR